jgi:flagellar assembly factor FliW
MSHAAALESPSGRIQTRFGEFDTLQSQVVTFAEGIPGFEACRRFVLVAAEGLTPLKCLQALDEPQPSFLTADAIAMRPDYRAELKPADRLKLGAAADDLLLWLVILTIDGHEVTANLKAPVVINPRRMLGRQVVLDEADYPVRWPLEAR